MKVKAICIDNVENDSFLTIGKIYTITIPEWAYGHKPSEIHNRYEHMAGLKDDNGEEILVPQDFFKLIDKHRNDQIDQLLK
jgi:hypothetical protein